MVAKSKNKPSKSVNPKSKPTKQKLPKNHIPLSVKQYLGMGDAMLSDLSEDVKVLKRKVTKPSVKKSKSKPKVKSILREASYRDMTDVHKELSKPTQKVKSTPIKLPANPSDPTHAKFKTNSGSSSDSFLCVSKKGGEQNRYTKTKNGLVIDYKDGSFQHAMDNLKNDMATSPEKLAKRMENTLKVIQVGVEIFNAQKAKLDKSAKSKKEGFNKYGYLAEKTLKGVSDKIINENFLGISIHKDVPTLNKIGQKILHAKQADLKVLWKEYFSIVLKSYGFNQKAIDTLFEWGARSHGWKELRVENTQYKFATKKELMTQFRRCASITVDIPSLDILFETHWFFNQAFYKDVQSSKENKMKKMLKYSPLNEPIRERKFK